MKDVVVKKFGGTSLANTKRIMAAAERVAASCREGKKVIVVVSAQEFTTDNLIEKARHINPDPAGRELDMLLSTGEQQSAALFAMGVRCLGFDAASLNAWQVGIHSTTRHQNAEIKKVDTNRILRELDEGRVVVVTGFQGINEFGDLTTLGRGASDTSAVAIAIVTNADICEIYTDVDGIYTADPRMVQSAVKLKSICYDDMIELASSGVRKPHNRAVEMAKRYGVLLYVRSSMTDSIGTWIKEDVGVERLLVSGIAIDRNIACITVLGEPNGSPLDMRLFDVLAGREIVIDTIWQSGLGNGVVFTVRKQDVKKTVGVLMEHQRELGFLTLASDENLAKLSVVGSGMSTNHGIAASVFRALKDAGIKIEMIAASEIKITVFVNEKQIIQAKEAVHDSLKPMFASAGV